MATSALLRRKTSSTGAAAAIIALAGVVAVVATVQTSTYVLGGSVVANRARMMQPVARIPQMARDRVGLRGFAKRDEKGYIIDEELQYDTNVYCQNLGGTAQLPFTEKAGAVRDTLKSGDPSAAAGQKQNVMEVINEEFDYMPVRFSVGEKEVAKGDEAELAKLLSFCILGGVPVEASAELTGMTELKEKGWGHVFFPNGLSLIPKTSSYDIGTDPNQLLADASVVQGGGDWDPNSDVWIP